MASRLPFTTATDVVVGVLGSVTIALAIVAVPGELPLLFGLLAAGALLLASSRLLPMAVLLGSAALTSADPIAGAALLAVGLFWMLATGERNYLPVAAVGVPLATYLVVGGVNISHFRGSVESDTVAFILVHILVLLVGIYLVACRAADSHAGKPDRVGDGQVMIAFVPGLAGLALMAYSSGIPFLEPARRFETSGASLVLFESLAAAVVLYTYDALARNDRLRGGNWTVLSLALGTLLLSGYRGWFIVSLAAVLAILLYFGPYRVTPLSGAVALAVVLVVFSGLQTIRRASDPSGISSSQAATRYGTESIPPGFRELHVGFRESIALTQRLVERRQIADRGLDDSLLLSDLNTVRPGKQQSGGDMVGDLLGRRSQGGLTPGAVGAAYTDLGGLSVGLFLLLGLLIGEIWRRAQLRPVWFVVYVLASLGVIHFMLRGIPKVSYFIVPLMFLALASSRWRGYRRGRGRIAVRDLQGAPRKAHSQAHEEP